MDVVQVPREDRGTIPDPDRQSEAPTGPTTSAVRARGTFTQGLFARDTIPCWIVFAVGLVLRLRGFNEYWINPDEGIYYSMVTWDTWGQFYGEFSANAHPPLFYVLLRLVGNISLDVGALRSISLVFGCLCAPAVYLFAKEYVGRGRLGIWTGFLAGLGVAVSYTAIEMSQIIRPYTMQFACTAFGLWFLARFLRRGAQDVRGARGALPAYSACMILALLTHYGAILILVGLAIAVVVAFAVRQLSAVQFRAVVLWNIPVLVAVLGIYFFHIRPNLDGSALARAAYDSWLGPLMIQSAGQIWTNVLGVLSHLGKEFEGPAALALVAGIGLAVWRRQILLVAFPIAALGVAIAASAAQKYPMGYSRHSMYLVVAIAPTIAFALASAFTSWRTAAPTLAAIAVLGFFRVEFSEGLGANGDYRGYENTLTRKDYASMREMMDHATKSPGVILMSTQTFCMLMPEFAKERQRATTVPDGSMRRFRWDKADVIVSKAWGMSMSPGHLGSPVHVYDFSRYIDRMIPELRFTSRRRITLMAGGWSILSDSVRELRESGGPQAKLIRRGQEVPGLLVIDLDIAGYLQYVRSTMRPR